MSQQFRELIEPGHNWEFMGRRRMFLTLSLLLTIASIAVLFVNKATRGSHLNWSIDFKGGTELVVGFDREVGAGEVRKALEGAGHKGVDVSSFAFTVNEQKRQGYLVRLAEFGAVKKEDADKIADELVKSMAAREVIKATWSGDTLFVRSRQAVPAAELEAFLKAQGFEMKPWSPEQATEYAVAQAGTAEYNLQASIHGLDRKVKVALTDALKTEAQIIQVDAVGPKAGAELRNDGIKSLLYAIGLIMLYIAFRFDFRYGPGTVAALIHDALVVVGVFGLFWVEFSLTTVAAVLTVIGYSMNDTVVVFDRIRENEGRFKDKKLDRVINISINETLSRTILTSLTTFVVTLAMNLLGAGLVKNFAFAMNIGIVVGTYSSVFIAAPTLLYLHEHYWSKRQPKERRLVRATASAGTDD